MKIPETTTMIIEVRAQPNKDWKEQMEAAIQKIEEQGYLIVGAEPIEEIRVTVVGRRFTVEVPLK